MPNILVVEDEAAMRKGLKDNLEAEEYTVDTAPDGKTGLEKLLDGSYDLVVLDVMLPKLSGFDLLKQARAKGITVPVILLTAKSEEIDKVVGLELGADDYLTKPFSLREFLARVKAILRRSGQIQGGPGKAVFGEVAVDLAACSVERNGKAVAMTSREFEVLKFLWQHRNEVVSRDLLLTKVWGYDESISTRTVDNFIVRIRRKIEADPSEPKFLLTIHGTGYKLIA